MRILLAEDDNEIASVVETNLADHNFEVETTPFGKEALSKLASEDFDLLVLDLNLPDMDGLEVCKKLRGQNSDCPILMLTARSSETDRVLGLELGGDDYLTKPFSVRELVARVKALLRRSGPGAGTNEGEPIELFGLRIHPDKRKVSVGGENVQLTTTEFDLLLHLASKPGRVYSREQLLKKVWGYGHEGYEHTVNSHINRLRAKIEADPSNPRYVRTVWGVGYKFPDTQDWDADR